MGHLFYRAKIVSVSNVQNGSMKISIAAALAFVGLAVPNLANAGDCLRPESRFELSSDTVQWSFSIKTSAQCLQGLRGKTMLIDGVRILQAPKSGKVELAGPAFRYIAPADQTADTFDLEITGSNRGIHGSSILRVDVQVRSPQS